MKTLKIYSIYLLILLGMLNRFRGTWGIWAKVNALIYASIIYYLYANNADVTTGLTQLFNALFLAFEHQNISYLNDVNYILLSTLLYSFLCFVGYIIGEMPGWGVGIGTLTVHREHSFSLAGAEKEYGWYTGIQWLATKLIPPTKETWVRHCQLAMTLRGVWWWAFTLAPLYLFDFNIIHLIIATLFLGISFPIACEIDYYFSSLFSLAPIYDENKKVLGSVFIYKDYKKEFNFNKVLFCNGHWEFQEVIYGAVQIISIIILFLLH